MISNHGNVIESKTRHKINAFINSRKYYHVVLDKNFYAVHRLVAIHFVGNPKKLRIVDHDDGDTLNNYYENLKWCTQSYNLSKMQEQTKKRKYSFLSEREKQRIKKLYRNNFSLRHINRVTKRSRNAIRKAIES